MAGRTACPVAETRAVHLGGSQVVGNRGACLVGIGSLAVARVGIEEVRCCWLDVGVGSLVVRRAVVGRRGVGEVVEAAWRRIG